MNHQTLSEPKTQVQNLPVCPFCSKVMSDSGDIFMERGKFDGKAYSQEGNVPVYKCPACSAEIAVIERQTKVSQGDPAAAAALKNTLTDIIECAASWINDDNDKPAPMPDNWQALVEALNTPQVQTAILASFQTSAEGVAHA